MNGTACVVQQRRGNYAGNLQKFWLGTALLLVDSRQASELQCADDVRLYLSECAKPKERRTTYRRFGCLTSPYRAMCLVLKPSTTVDGVWERVGQIHPADDTLMYLEFRGDMGADMGLPVVCWRAFAVVYE